MNVRTRNPAAGIASASTSRYETRKAKNIAAVSARYATTDVATSNSAGRSRGVMCGASTLRQFPSAGVTTGELIRSRSLSNRPTAVVLKRPGRRSKDRHATDADCLENFRREPVSRGRHAWTRAWNTNVSRPGRLAGLGTYAARIRSTSPEWRRRCSARPNAIATALRSPTRRRAAAHASPRCRGAPSKACANTPSTTARRPLGTAIPVHGGW